MTFAERSTWDHVHGAASRIHDPKAGVYRIFLRGKPGWRDTLAFLTTVLNSFNELLALYDAGACSIWNDAPDAYGK